MKKLLFSLLTLFFIFNLQAQQVESYSINIEFFPEDAQMWNYPVSPNAFMRGNSKVKLSELNTDESTFYMHGEFKIDSIISNNKVITSTSEKILYDNNYSLTALKTTIKSKDISPDKTVHIYYSGFMNASRARSLSDYMNINKEEGVFIRAYGYSLWFPLFLEPELDSYKADFKAITITLPEKFKAVVTGKLINETINNNKYISIWNPGIVDITNIQCAAREYKVISEDNVYVYYMTHQNNARKIIDYTVKLRNLFKQNLRDVNDVDSLYIIEMPEYGNISSRNVVGISSDLFNDFENNINSKYTIAHELIHPYVKIPVLNDNPFSALITEGFPSFFQVYALDKTLAEGQYDLKKKMEQVEASYIKKKETGKNWRGNPLPKEKPILEISFNEIGEYKDRFILSDRVWLFIYHLWDEMGANDFDAFLKELFQFSTIDYNSFEELVLKYIPKYKGKFDLWLNTIDYPETIHIKNN